MSKPCVPLWLAALLLGACSGDPYQGVYENIKIRNESLKTPTERAITPSPSYDQYKKEREQQKQE